MSISRKIIDKTVGILGTMLQWRVINKPKPNKMGKVCVNLGCGLAVAPGWINIDASLNALFGGAPNWILGILYRISGANRYYTKEEYRRLLHDHQFVFHDLAKSLPFPKSSVDYFFSSHFFEHLFPDDAERLLGEMHRALKDGGRIRIAVPDLEYAIQLYSIGQKRRMLDDYFFVNDLSSFLARHKYMYDFELLKEVLEKIGYKDIRRCEFNKGEIPDLAFLDNRPEETLFVEAKRGLFS
jgi:predicted SAM-dependent methyltransferase